ncbi:hypothetical protein CFP56_009080 [Quercus suber]|uniref:Neprosin PEP catalytic domain-containing protein n=1 Tax=Quercus suber TaxID=58331 RepID=A0AAW0L4C2_QUESU
MVWAGFALVSILNAIDETKFVPRRVTSTPQHKCGHFPKEGPGKASFFDKLNVIDCLTVLRGPRNSRTMITNPNCYNLINSGDSFYYGGPGRNPKCP